MVIGANTAFSTQSKQKPETSTVPWREPEGIRSKNVFSYTHEALWDPNS